MRGTSSCLIGQSLEVVIADLTMQPATALTDRRQRLADRADDDAGRLMGMHHAIEIGRALRMPL